MADDKQIIFSMYKVSKTYPPNKTVIKDISLSFFLGAKIGIIGLNGSGKSTLLRIIAGTEKSFQGELVFAPGYSVGLLEQEPHLDESKTVKEVVQEGVQEIVDVLKAYEDTNLKFGLPEVYEDPDAMDKLMNEQARLQEKIDQYDAWNLDTRLNRAMDALQCPPDDQPIKELSGGERRRVALCRLLLKEPDILLLDEPTNHLDAESMQWLEQHLQQYKGTVICITHDRYFLDNVAGWILELDRGEGIPWKGNYTSWLEQKTKRMEMEEKGVSKRRKTLERELEWVRMAPKARHAKSKARLQAYDKMLNEDVKQKEDKLEIYIPNGPRLGDKVIQMQGVSKSYGDKVLIQDLTVEFVKLFSVNYNRGDHIIRSARSLKQNLAEGATRNSVKNYIQFIGFSRASNEELLEDYKDLAKQWQIPIWSKSDPRLSSFTSLSSLSSLSQEAALNLMIDLITRTNYLLDQQRRGLEKAFIEKGGYTENLAQKRREQRGY